MMPKKTKILVISTWAPPTIGGPQNLYNLFSQYSPSSYALLTSYNTLRITGINKDSWLPGEYIFFDHRGQVDREKDFDAPGALAQRLPWQQQLMVFMKKVPGLTYLFSAFLTLLNIALITIVGVREVRRRKFNVLLGISDQGAALVGTYLVSLFTGVPYAVYLYDIYKGNYFAPFERFLSIIAERTIFQRASLVILTNEGTESFYKRRYGQTIRTAVVHNSVFAQGYEKQRTPYRPKPPYLIVFTGHVYWAQEQAVLNLIDTMSKLRDLPVRLDLYAPKPPASLQKAMAGKKNIRLSAAPQSAMPKIQSGATLLVLPLAWHTKSPDIIATATPGKFTDYLASGRPMLIHAPDYSYVSQIAKKHNLGLVVDQNDVDVLAQTIRRFFKNPTEGQEYIRNSLRMFYRNHNARKNARKLIGLVALHGGKKQS